MAPKVRAQIHQVGKDATLSEATAVLGQTKFWEKAGDIASQKMLEIIGRTSPIGTEVMLSFCPMVTYKHVVKHHIKNKFGRNGAFLLCTSLWTLGVWLNHIFSCFNQSWMFWVKCQSPSSKWAEANTTTAWASLPSSAAPTASNLISSWWSRRSGLRSACATRLAKILWSHSSF